MHSAWVPDDFSDAVLARYPGLSTCDVQRLREKVQKALEGYPVEEWTVRFADVIIDHRGESFAKPFFEGSVARGRQGWTSDS